MKIIPLHLVKCYAAGAFSSSTGSLPHNPRSALLAKYLCYMYGLNMV